MSTQHLKNFSTKRTHQSQPIPGRSDMKANHAGGFSFEVDDWKRLERFLILGTEGGTYYVNQQTLTKENAEAVLRCINKDGLRTVNTIVEVSDQGRAPKNDSALFALALCAAADSLETRRAALEALPKVARIGTHLFNFASFVEQFRGWGRALRTAIGNWYNDKDADKLAYQLVKYRQRGGWSHRDLLRLAHPVAPTEKHHALYSWVTQGEASKAYTDTIAYAFDRIQAATDKNTVVDLIQNHNLPRECVPTEFLNDVDVWSALLKHMPITALVRNLGKMTKVGLLESFNDATQHVVNLLTNEDLLRKGRVHPMQILAALKTYENGHGTRGKLSWNPVTKIVDALDNAFYKTFQNVIPTGKRFYLGLDVSGSMCWPELQGIPGLTPRIGSAAMALITASTEQNYHIAGFTGHMQNLNISPRQRLDDVVRNISNLPFGSTDCALPMRDALSKRLPVDTFVIYTDSESWYGSMHPCQALQEYRQKMSIPAKLAVVSMVANWQTIADPKDAGMLDVTGFDTATPKIISDFARD
ncbi:RNA-binding protein [Candidatus Pacearchaeota archaeon]|nr:RNA-binding protein [Candidatus Pacearchaeota archaeon]|tara:strand:+ start:28015 stop:29604 length:1590 start_codon:yes stop_codon:yes gene_type:complete